MPIVWASESIVIACSSLLPGFSSMFNLGVCETSLSCKVPSFKPNVAVHAYNLSIWGNPGLHSYFKAILEWATKLSPTKWNKQTETSITWQLKSGASLLGDHHACIFGPTFFNLSFINHKTTCHLFSRLYFVCFFLFGPLHIGYYLTFP